MSVSRRTFLGSCASGALVLCAAALGACSGEKPITASSLEKLTPQNFVQALIGSMSLEAKVAQLFVVTPEQLTGAELVLGADDALRDALANRPVGGIIFFGGNLENTQQTKDMLAGIKSIAQDANMPPLFLCVDEEGGEVQRIGGKPGFDAPSIDHACNIGATGDVAVARNAATSIAHTLLDLGFTVDFAPSCDVSSGPGSVMRWRSFSTDPAVVATMVAEEIRAFNEAGILCSAKHFPGIGDPQQDSHDGPIFTSKTREELEGQLLPFKAAIEVGVPMVMVGHLSVPALTGGDVPAAIAPQIVDGLLRKELGYNGIVITDSLSMGAMGAFAAPRDVATMAIEAGCDLALMPADFDAAYTGLLEAVQLGRISEQRINQSLTRILTAKLTR